MSQVKVYDWNGTLVTVEGFRTLLRETEPELFDNYYNKGKDDPNIRRQFKPRITEIFEDANIHGLYPVELHTHVRERLELDKQQGYARAIFSTVPEAVLR